MGRGPSIEGRKNAEDAKRARIFTKLIRDITIAARAGADPAGNAKLRGAVDKALAANMPKDKIEKAIRRGSGADGGADLQEVRYEGYGPGGVALIIETLTDNPVRTVADVRHALSKNGGNLGASLTHISEIMHTGEKLPLANLTTSVREAVSTISRKGYGCVIVLDDQGDLAGIITDGDIRRHLDKAIDQMQIEELMLSAFGNRAAVFASLWKLRPQPLRAFSGPGNFGQMDIEKVLDVFLPETYPKSFEELSIPLKITGTDYYGNALKVLESGDLRKAVALYEEQLGPLHPRVAAARLSLGAAYGEREALEPAREQFERMYFEYHLAREASNMTRIAERTGVERTHLYRKLRQLGLHGGRRTDEGSTE